MSVRSYLKAPIEIFQAFAYQPVLSLRLLRNVPRSLRGFNYSHNWRSVAAERIHRPFSSGYETAPASANPLKAFFDSRQTGRGIWKWTHYFDIYHRHFSKFVGRDVHVLEIGIYSGGSLDMWRHYFGPKCCLYGVDIEEACKVYENEYTRVFIGDQGDHQFWKAFKECVPSIDIVIDDGGHTTAQQIVTLEEMLPHIRPGGIYLCEDIHGVHSGFAAYAQGLVNNLNAMKISKSRAGSTPSEFQTWILAMHFYPFVTVVEKADSPVRQFIAPKHGTEWQPFKPRP